MQALASFGARLDAASPETPLELAKMRRLESIVDFLERTIACCASVAGLLGLSFATSVASYYVCPIFVSWRFLGPAAAPIICLTHAHTR